jgi:cell division protein FtsL
MFSGKLVRQTLLLLIVAIVVYMGAGFVRQTGISRQRREELRSLEARIAEADVELSALQDQLEYVEAPEAAEEWARENGWVKDDEQSVVVVAPSAAPAETGEAPGEGAESRSPGEVWWDFFFGDP